MTNPLDLPFDADEMIAGLKPWIETESPTFDAAAVNRMMDVVQHDLAALGARVERIPGRMGLGDSVRATMPHPKAGEGGILLLGHMDTVHPVGTLKQLPFKREGDICYGPGLMDMKGGNYVFLDALRKLLAAGVETPLPVTVLFTPDEEIGTPSTRELIETEAKRHKYILVPEPARPDGGAVIGRYAIARFNLQTRGKPSHAGWALAEGRSAIAEMAKSVAVIEGMTTDDCTFSLGVFHAGQWVNCVSSFCDAEVLSMAKTQELLDEGVAKMLALNSDSGDVIMEVKRGVTRPVWEPNQPGTMAMLKLAQEIAGEIGFEMSGASAGGGSDGNFTGYLGLPTLDSIGVRGKGLHTLTEHIEIDSLVERAKLAAALYCRLGA
ncbi:M20/M25/M40 family metallo-hydrolase [Pseudosulfitobacter pseudonitzschiae]|uniref:M20/M25/M40 family metallo-hydrolase n=1 Tax=Pseudosulfitobacter pseudonitzschiae TaxID=1402135 RepID=UPI001AF8A1EE|nr:M20/M25/M40 family metallo-hydrolase [Pseudosulfitobacter pseudonitzschiae]MBM1817960.1 M20/M25/M40 family metallo-hydrolase [Pseudosulfitobacter pseudonitzschiae]MBM1835018.1 M20/M25/M40 family metallo-hydrolase [Pseudosulfitobacter pseudonitzschiae]MBM1839819.1 M20/M25/M40 family metallo-hydrolase [Pseudosulfitobacter pseudonitzschiae]MBM1844733.1 M20/M25/M40 family metallo-hydrolase [Pseudosulfitobacter pseudonitzschiae]MBM1849504.1 M20/M25/M40 family metallo-hydrolase [Pseudosulfitobact